MGHGWVCWGGGGGGSTVLEGVGGEGGRGNGVPDADGRSAQRVSVLKPFTDQIMNKCEFVLDATRKRGPSM